jgi:catechol 2,3-dioxygenase-like lactoylglutathione lyase family enzyme
MKLGNIDHVAISVLDLNSSIEWYHRVLGLERRHADAWEGPPIMLCAEDTCLALFQARGEKPVSIPDYKTTPLIWHIAFKVDRQTFLEAERKFHELAIGYRIADHGICHSIYIFDPDGHQIEIVTYEISSVRR